MKTVLRSTAWYVLILSVVAWVALAQGSGAGRTAETREVPKIDKPALIKYLRYAEGFGPQVQVSVDDPKPSTFSGLYQVVVRLKATQGEAVRTYYLTKDGERLISGSVFDLRGSPFAANLPLLKQEGAPALGPDNAPVQIYIFSDFECPYCREEARVLRQGIDKAHTKDVRIIFKDFPLEPIHPWARNAAISGECIAEQGTPAFWSFHDWIYEHQSELNASNLRDKIGEFAKTQNLDTGKLSACQTGKAAADRVQRTLEEGRELTVMQTPTLFVNGRMLPGALSADQINLLIQMELEHRQQQAAENGQRCCEVTIPTIGKH